jgi:hypothetical protein
MILSNSVKRRPLQSSTGRQSLFPSAAQTVRVTFELRSATMFPAVPLTAWAYNLLYFPSEIQTNSRQERYILQRAQEAGRIRDLQIQPVVTSTKKVHSFFRQGIRQSSELYSQHSRYISFTDSV